MAVDGKTPGGALTLVENGVQIEAPEPPDMLDGTIYGRLGGMAAMSAVMDGLYERVLHDAQLKGLLSGVDLERLQAQQRDFLAELLGGPAANESVDMGQAHAGLRIEKKHLERVAKHFTAVLAERGAGEALQAEVFQLLTPLAGKLVDQQTPLRKGKPRKRARVAANSKDAPKGERTRNMPSIAELGDTLAASGGALHEPDIEKLRADSRANTRAVSAVVTALASAKTADEAAKAALDAVREAFGWAYGSYWKRDPRENALQCAAESGAVNGEFAAITRSASFAEGVGLGGRAWRLRELQVMENLAGLQDSVRAPAALRAGMKSAICFPIVCGGQVTGTIDFFSVTALEPSEERRETLRAVAALISSSFDRHAEAERSAEEAANASAVRYVLEAIDGAVTVEDACKRALDTVRKVFGWSYGSFWRLDRAAGVLKFHVESGTVDAEFTRVTQESTFARGVGLAGRTWQRRELIFVEDLGQLTDCVRAPAAHRAGVKSGICFPVAVRGDVYGTLDFFALETLAPSESQFGALRDIGRLVSSAVERIMGANEAARTQSMMDQSPVNMMYADTGLVLRYLNPAAEKQLRALEPHLPIRVDEMIGANIDVFHKNPGHQRRILADPNNLPVRANIRVGPETLDLLVSPIRDAAGAYSGAMVTWEVITKKLEAEQREKHAQESERAAAQKLQGSVDTLLKAVSKAIDGDLTAEVGISGDDAVGRMGDGLSKLLANLRSTLAKISNSAQQLSSSSEELTAVSQQMASNAEETSTQAGAVSAASEQVSKNVQVAATGAEEMSASIREIAKSSTEAARVAKQAVSVADSANATIKELGDASAEIGKVIKVITSIAQQTNLLALNATIEAARAGEAGKGFAVVANEVKELAKQTAAATEDISQKIESIQAGSRGAVKSIGEVAGIIDQISDISNTIASSVEEQTATTNEITRNVTEAARGSGEIAENISGVATAARETSQGASDTLEASNSLSRMANELHALINQYTLTS